MAQGSDLMKYRLRHKDGSYRWVEDDKRLVGGVAGKSGEIVGVWADITERKRAEEVMRTWQRVGWARGIGDRGVY